MAEIGRLLSLQPEAPVRQYRPLEFLTGQWEEVMNRREWLQHSAALGIAAAAAAPGSSRASLEALGTPTTDAAPAERLQPPQGAIPVAFLISDGAVVIDFCGPWEVFASVAMRGAQAAAFRLYTVAETMHPVTASAGMQIVPNFTFATAPAPRIIVIPAQDGASEAALQWIRQTSRSTDVTMSVCTGAFVLAQTGLLSGKVATTHHNAYSDFAMQFPDVHVKRGARFVESGNLATAGGLSSGIDLALRVVERYFGRDVAAQTADQMEYQGQGWMNPDSNAVYRAHRVSTAAHPLCPVCEMDVDPASSPRSMYRSQTYYFCMPRHKSLFDAAPDAYLALLSS
jgi:putative intracellular protease/amidase/YHS domain-containing protein